MFKYAKLCVRTDRPSGNFPKVRVRVKASYIGNSTYDYTLVATDTYRSERRSHPDPDSTYSGSEFSESESEIQAFKYEFFKKIEDFYGKKFGSESDHHALDADPDHRIQIRICNTERRPAGRRCF
jgi:hypothetical protein